MNRKYDLFEKLPDGSPRWRGVAIGLHEARLHLLQLRKTTRNECFAIHLLTKDVVARVNVSSATGGKPLVFQITYDPQRAARRAEVFRLQGYEVVTAFGNEAAKVVLTLPEKYDLFIVGHDAPEETRREMVDWLKAHFPGVRIIALNPPVVEKLPGADFNVKINGPETLLPVIANALATSHGGAAAC